MSQNSEILSRSGKKKALELVYKAKSSHIGGSFSVADILAVLYEDIARISPDTIANPDRDRIFYSKGHACAILYAILCDKGFLTLEELESFSADGSYLTTHVNHKVKGVELSTGSLGHAMSVACGGAYAGKLGNKDWKVYCILSDGELDEGSNWEAILFAAHHQLKNLTVVVDYNRIQSLGDVKDVINLDSLAEKFNAFNFNVCEINGHQHDEIYNAFKKDFDNHQPKVIIANTIKGKGVDFMEDRLLWHYKSPDEKELNNALNQLNRS